MSESGMMDALTWLHTSTDAPPALLKNAEVQADETASTITNVNTPATPEAAPANLKKPETTRPIEASVDPLREARYPCSAARVCRPMRPNGLPTSWPSATAP